MKRNCWTNSVPYGYGGRSAETSVLPVRIIMSPTCSSRFLVGRKTRSAAARTTNQTPPGEATRSPRETRSREEPYGMFPAVARYNRRSGGVAHVLGIRWYVRPALRARRNLCALALAGVVAGVGCGGAERQDEDEPEGDFAVEVVRASFPEDQKLAKSSNLLITVRNAGQDTIPNIAVTVDGFNFRKADPELADPERPQFVINGRPREIGGVPGGKEGGPPGCGTAPGNTWAGGPPAPRKQKTL